MSDILDVDLTDDAAQYQAFVVRADEFYRVVHDWYVSKFGHEPARANMHFAYQRVLVERHHWRTLRNALDRWPLDGTVDGPQPGPGPVPPAPAGPPPGPPAPPTARPGEPLRIPGPFAARFYSYWSNAVVLNGTTYLFAGHRQRGPTFYAINGRQVTDMGSLVPYGGETEGWSWTADGWIYLCDGPRYRRVNPFTGQDDVIYDISQTHPRCFLWQPHSSDNGAVHSATVRQMDAPWGDVGTICVRGGAQKFYAAQGRLDESQVDGTGRWLMIKESFQRDKMRLDNRIIDSVADTDTWWRDEEGALGHSDMGPGYAIGEDDQIGACKWVDLATRQERVLLSTWNMGHVSIRASRWLLSDATGLNLVLLNEGALVVYHHGVPGGDYDRQVRANLSPCGTRAAFMMDGDAYVLEL